jgi:dienelactone hydrolase
MTAEPILASDIIGLTRRAVPSYRKDAAEDGWNQMQAWFRKYKVLG